MDLLKLYTCKDLLGRKRNGKSSRKIKKKESEGQKLSDRDAELRGTATRGTSKDPGLGFLPQEGKTIPPPPPRDSSPAYVTSLCRRGLITLRQVRPAERNILVTSEGGQGLPKKKEIIFHFP